MRIVGIGASAGGLIALEEFFRNTPSDSGAAFVVVQHLNPTQKALLPELLQRSTDMPVQEAQQRMIIRPDCVYVIPPNRELRVADGVLQLSEPTNTRGLRLPINVLFSSLASAYNDQAIAVVLSGMGTDGTLGLQAIKTTGGLTAAQEPESAQFDAMPKSAIAAGCVDIVTSAEALPRRILDYIHRIVTPQTGCGGDWTKSMKSIEPIIRLLQQGTRHDFSLYKPSTLHRRIDRRMAIHGFTELAEYTHYLEHNSQEVQLLFRELLIGVTQFFRDSNVWMYLAEHALPDLLKRTPDGTQLRAWVVGCSTGEEAYSLAMVFAEATQHLDPSRDISLQIFASDLSPEAIETGRRGCYPLTIADSVSEQRLSRFFTKHSNHYQVTQAIRNMVLFAQHNVTLDPPFTKLDLITCRNLLIYFDPMLQRRLLPLFHYSLRPKGLMVLGGSETVGRMNHLFTTLKANLRIYQKQEHETASGSGILLESFPPLSTLSKEEPVPAPHVPPQVTDNLQSAADHLLLQGYSPAAVVLNSDADILYISGRTGKYLEPAAGKANWNIHAMAREGLRVPLFAALKQASAQQEPVELADLEVQTEAGVQHVDVTVQAFQEPVALKDMIMVVFRDRPAGDQLRHKGKRSSAKVCRDEDIRQYQLEINRLTEEARLSREGLQATNEELQSTNEELQSANEELTTSKEEMQSMNEELQTINAELQTKLDDLALAQSDMQNVLNSIEIAVLFLDQKLNVRRYTARASRIFSLRDSDIGRPLSDLTTSLDYPHLQDDARETLATLNVSEKQITAADDHWFSVRIIPYRRLDNVIDGVVITLVDITETKKLESSLRSETLE